MIRPALLAAVAAIALATPATAQQIVHDPVSNANSLASWAKQVTDMLRQYQQLQAQYQATIRNLGSGNIASALGGLTRSYSPASTMVPGLLRGQGSWGQAGTFANENLRYMPPTMDPWAQEMERRRMTTANAQAIAAAGLADTDVRIRELTALQGQIDNPGSTVIDAGVLNAQIAGFQHNLSLNRSTLDQVGVMLATAGRMENERAEQAQRESADLHMRSTQWAVDALGAGSFGGGATQAPTTTGRAIW